MERGDPTRDDWTSDEFGLPGDLYAKAIPQAQVHRLAGQDHQLSNDLSEVARPITSNLKPDTPMQISHPAEPRVTACHGWPEGQETGTPLRLPHGAASTAREGGRTNHH
jgi:hypothetical protein